MGSASQVGGKIATIKGHQRGRTPDFELDNLACGTSSKTATEVMMPPTTQSKMSMPPNRAENRHHALPLSEVMVDNCVSTRNC